MKVIPKNDLLKIIEKSPYPNFTLDIVEDMFYQYGDDYYKVSFDDDYQLCKKNEARKLLFKGETK